jgi:type IV secretory pathway VirJ component
MKSRTRRICFGLALAATLTAAIFLAHLGYLGGDPVSLHPAGSSKPAYSVVHLSGDMGNNVGESPSLIGRLNASGISVVSLNSLSFFRQQRSPNEIAGALGGLLRRAREEFGASRVVVIGQSFGADALVLGLARLPPAERARIHRIILVVPTRDAYLRATPSELFNIQPPQLATPPSARGLTWAPLLCIHGQRELDSLCPALTMANVTQVTLPGGHLLNHDREAVFRVIAAYLDVRRGGEGKPRSAGSRR